MSDDTPVPPPAPPPPAISARQAAARVQRGIRNGRPRSELAGELQAAGLSEAEIAQAIATGDKAERRSNNNLMIWAASFSGLGVLLALIGLIVGVPEGANLFGAGVGLLSLGIPAFIFGIVRLARMS